MRIKDLVKTCEASPSQWEAYTENGRPVYIRYRWGHLSIRLGLIGGSITDAVAGKEIFGAQLADDLHGVIEWDEVGPIVAALPEMGGPIQCPA